MLVTVEVAGRHLRLLVDSGSEISIIKKAIPDVPLKDAEITATGVTGSIIPVQGTQTLPCRLGRNRITHRFTVASVSTIGDGLIGLDFMAAVGMVVDVPQNCVRANGGFIEKVAHSADYRTADNVSKQGMRKVKLARKTEVAPLSEQLLEGRLHDKLEGDLLFEPASVPLGLRMAHSVHTASGKRVWVNVVNLSGVAIHLDKGQPLGTVEPLMGQQEIIGYCAAVEATRKHSASPDNREQEFRSKLEHLPEEAQNCILRVLRKYSVLFEEPGPEGCTLPVYHRIYTNEEVPITKRPYRVPHYQKGKVAEHLRDMLDREIIAPSSSPWSAPVILVPKKSNGGEVRYRFCTDFRGLNQITKTDAYPLPLIVETLETLGRSRFFSTLDLASGYHQIPIWPGDCEKTAFSTLGGHYEYRKMAFGLVNAPATFQRLMDHLLAELKGEECLVYLDDIVIFSATIGEHGARLDRVLTRLQNANLKVNLSKCSFAQEEVKYLGHVVSAEGLKPDPEKIKAVRDYPVPKSVKELKSFLGLAGYYRRFIPRFADTAKPLTSLLKQEAPYSWGLEQERAFEALRKALCADSLLIYPDFKDPFILATDASGVALGAILSQVRDGKERPIAYVSRQLNAAERNYSTTERELLAVVWATAQFRCYLLGRTFTLQTDHSALKWMLRLKDPSARLTRWALRLAEFSYEVVHRPGLKHQHADALSRAVGTIQSSPTPEELRFRREQQRDSWCQSTLSRETECVKTGENGLLYWTEGGENVDQWRVMVPASLRDHILELLHNAPWSGHPGVIRTTNRIKRYFYWPKVKEDVEKHVRKCQRCNERKTPAGLQVPLGQTYEAHRPWEQVSLDIVGPLPTSLSGKRYLLTMVDTFSRYAEAVPLREQTAKETARGFVECIVLRHGAPKRVLTDQGRNFVSDVFRQTCKQLGVKKLQTTAYHPESNGVVERFHRTLVEAMAHVVRRDGRDWDRWLPFVLMAYRTTPHTSTGYTPHSLIYGKELDLPFDCSVAPSCPPTNLPEYVAAWQEKVANAFTEVREAHRKARHARAKAHDKGKVMREYEIGEKVYLYEPALPAGHARKFHRPWSGPHTVVAQPSPWTYKLALNKGGYGLVHVNRIKPAPDAIPEERDPHRDPNGGIGAFPESENPTGGRIGECENWIRGNDEDSLEGELSHQEEIGDIPPGNGTDTSGGDERSDEGSEEESAWDPEAALEEISEEVDSFRSPYHLRSHPERDREATSEIPWDVGVNVQDRRRIQRD